MDVTEDQKTLVNVSKGISFETSYENSPWVL